MQGGVGTGRLLLACGSCLSYAPLLPPHIRRASPDEACGWPSAGDGEAAALVCRAQAAEQEVAELRRKLLETETGREEERAALGRLQARVQGLEAEAEGWRRELRAAAEERVRAAEAAAARRERRAAVEVELLRRRLAAAEGGQPEGLPQPCAEAGMGLGAARQQQVAAVVPAVCLSPVSIRLAAFEPNGGLPSPAATDDGGGPPRIRAMRSSPGRALALSKPINGGPAATDLVAATADPGACEAAAGGAVAAEARLTPPAAYSGEPKPQEAPPSDCSHGLAAAHNNRAPSGSPGDLFGIFRSLDGTSCSSASGGAAASATPARAKKGAENRPPPSSKIALPASPSASLDAVAATAAGEDGGRQRRRAAKLYLALGSQESCSQGAEFVVTGPPVATARLTQAPPPLETALAQQVQVTSALPCGLVPADAAVPRDNNSPAAAMDASAAMLAVDDIARYLAD